MSSTKSCELILVIVFEFDGIQNLTIKEAPTPKPQTGEVLVKVHAVSLNVRLGTDYV